MNLSEVIGYTGLNLIGVNPYLLKRCMAKPLEILGVKGTVKGVLERIRAAR